jgi:DNA-binding response OmpR family regulator
MSNEPGSVLIVDDDRDTREMYANFFHGLGCATFTAGDGREALRSAGAFPPDVILLDLALPELDGWELARRFRADPRMQRVVIVAVSGHAELSARMRAMSAGADLFVPKPVTPADLLARVRALGPSPSARP